MVERKCDKCNKLEETLADNLIDLLEDEESNCKLKYCEVCIKNIIKCDCGRRDHSKTFKSKAVIDFDVEQKERKQYAKLELVPQVLIEMIVQTIHDKSTLQSILRRDIIRFANDFDEKKKREKHTIVKTVTRDYSDQLPNYIRDISNMDIEEPVGTSGSREQWQKGIKSIIKAFRRL